MADPNENDATDQNSAALRDSFLQQLSQVKPNESSPDQSVSGNGIDDQKSAALRDSFLQSLNQTAKSKESIAEQSPEDAAYVAKVNKYMPEAREYYKNTDPAITAAKEGLQRSFILGPALNEVGADIEAALPSSITGLQGESYGERRQDFKARSEALTRAGTEKSPLTAAGAELAGSFAVPMGGIAGATEKAITGAAPALTGLAAKSAGMATEAGIYAGLGAAAEKAFGTEPESEKPDILSTAGIGAGLGAILPGVGKLAGAAAEHLLPDWAKEKIAGSDYQVQQFLKHVDADKAAGENVLGVDGALKAIADNPDAEIGPFDIGGTRTQGWLLKSFKGRGDALDNFQNMLSQRLEGATDRFSDALMEASGLKGDLNLDDIANQSKEYAKEQNDVAYKAANGLDNGRGKWNSNWEKQFSDPRAKIAVDQVNSDMADIYGNKFSAPINRVGTLPVDSLQISNAAKDFLRQNGLKTLDEVAAESKNNFQNIFNPPQANVPGQDGMLARRLLAATGMPESAINNLSDSAAQDLAKLNELNMGPKKAPIPQGATPVVNEINRAIKNKNLDRLTLTKPDSMNVEWLNKYQQRLNDQKQILARENLSRNMPIMGRLEEYKKQIVGGLKGKVNPDGTANPYYNPNTYNPLFEKAHTQAAQFHRQAGAFETGAQFFKSLANGQDASALANQAKTMDPKEATMFSQGLLGQMKYLATEKGVLNYNKLNKWFSNPYLRETMESTLGPQKFEKIESVVKSESILQQSLKRAAELERKSGGPNNSFLNNKDLLSAGVGYFLEPHLGLAGFLYNHVISPYMGVKYANRLRTMLESGDLKQMQRVYDQLINNPKTRTPFLDTVAHVVATNMAQARTGNALQRPIRATGGRIPDADKLFKEAKKELDSHTKPMLSVDDDAIVHALRIAQGRV